MIRPLVCGALLGALSAAPAAAQGRSDLVLRGIQAYQSLDYRAAAELLRASLAPGVRPALPAAERSRALCYLGATEVFRSFRDSAAAVFRELVLGDPRYRPDALVFPPQVTDLFEAVRRSTPAFAVTLPADAEFGAGGGAAV